MNTDTNMGWRGRVYLGIGIAVYSGRVGNHESHRHYASQLSICLTAPLIAADAHHHVEGNCLLFPANTDHQLVAPNADVLFIYAEPTTPLGRLMDSATAVLTSAPREKLARFWHRLHAALVAESVDVISNLVCEFLSGDQSMMLRHCDERLIALLKHPTFQIVPPNISEAAALLHLSPSRFSHLFSKQMAIAYRRFVLWRKLLSAIDAAMAGNSLTWAAHQGGFADAAHFSRTFHAMFGLAPSAALGSNLEFKTLIGKGYGHGQPPAKQV